MVKKKKTGDPLVDLLNAANPETLITLIAELAEDRPDVRRECFDYLKKHGSLTTAQNPCIKVKRRANLLEIHTQKSSVM